MPTEATTATYEEITPEVDKILEQWKDEEGNVIMVFHAIQDHYGYVPRNVAMYVAQALEIPLAQVYEVITFYHFFNLEPPAKNTVKVCTGTACYLKGAQGLIDAFKKELDIKPNEKYNADRSFKVDEVRCLGCCGLAPVITINEEVHGRLTPEDVPGLIAQAKANQK